MMAETVEPPITRCAPGRRTPKDQIRVRERPTFAMSQANGLLLFVEQFGLSHQIMVSRAQQENEAEIMSVALNQPHRKGAEEDFRKYHHTDANYATSELGKFCRRHHDSGGDNYRTSTAFMRYKAGCRFAEVINDELIANGLAGRQRGDAEYTGIPDEKALNARKDLCRIKRANAEAVLRGADRRGSLPMGVWAMTTLCFDDRPLPDHLQVLGVDLLYALSLHFGIEKPGYHDEGRQ